jgi:hypothetical protein
MMSEQAAIKLYHWYQHQAKANVDPEQLIVFNLKQGWDQLCQFVTRIGNEHQNSDEETFPHTNQMRGCAAKTCGDVLEVITQGVAPFAGLSPCSSLWDLAVRSATRTKTEVS